MPLLPAYETDIDLVPGVLPPAYGSGTPIPGQLMPAYGYPGGFDFTNPNIAFDSRITFTRASSATYFDAAGTLKTVTTNVPRANYYQDHNPSTLSNLGFLIEEARTNSIRNNTMGGAAAGSPGTAPTNWVTVVPTEITQTIVGTGTEDGIEYIDIRVNGTTTADRDYVVFVDGLTGSAASNGQAWAMSSYARLVGGSFSNVSLTQLNARALDGGGSVLATFATNGSFVPTSATLRTQRFVASGTIASATVVTVRADMFFRAASGTTVDFTIRIGLPQLEQGAFATSVIKTTTAAATRAADVASVTGTNFSNWFNASEGTFVTSFSLLSAASYSLIRGIFHADDGSADNRVGNLVSASSTEVSNRIVSGAVAANPANVGSIATTAKKVAIAYKTADGAAVLAGGTVQTSSPAGTIPATTLRIGNTQNTTDYLNGHIASFNYYPYRLTNQQIKTMTT